MLKTFGDKAVNDHSDAPLLPLSCLLWKQKDCLGVTAGGLGLSYSFAFVNLKVWRGEDKLFYQEIVSKTIRKADFLVYLEFSWWNTRPYHRQEDNEV